jgi:hypothetical protein
VISSVVRSYELYETNKRNSIPLFFRAPGTAPPPARGAALGLARLGGRSCLRGPRPGGPGARAGPMAGPDTTRHWADAGAGAGPAPTTTAARAAVLVCGYTVRLRDAREIVRVRSGVRVTINLRPNTGEAFSVPHT